MVIASPNERDPVNEILYSGQRDGLIRIWEQKSEPQYKVLGRKRAAVSEKGDEEQSERQKFSSFTKNTKLEGSAQTLKIGLPTGGLLTIKKKGGVQTKQEKEFVKKPSENYTNKKQPEKENRDGHTSVVTAILPLPKLQFLASASLDKKIILWDLLENKPKREYVGYHKKGIVALDFSEALILLISGGFDHEIYVWNPYIDAPIHNLSGHVAPIVGLAFVPNPLHIVSVDLDCIMKVWDTKKFKCVDSPVIENMEDKLSFKIQRMCIIPQPLKILLVGKNLYAFGYDKNNTLTSADENVSLCARFVAGSLSLMTPVGNKVKLWNLLTGEVKKIFSDLSKSDISAMILDSKGKRFIMGDMDGNVGVYNATNGALLKTLTKHEAEIISLIHAEPKLPGTLDLIISASIDNNIKIHDDKDLGESKWLVDYNPRVTNIISLLYEKEIGKLFIGGSNGVINLYEIATGKGNEEFSDLTKDAGPEAEVTAIAFFTGYNSLCYSNSAGKLKFVAIPPLQIKHEILYIHTNTPPNSTLPSSIFHICFCNETKRIFTADEKFFIKCYDITKVLAHIEEVAKQPDKAKRNFKITKDMIEVIWEKKAHDDSIKSLEYIMPERLLVTTSMDKNVKIWSSETGLHIESLKQNKMSTKIKPIAYKKVESNEIYTPRMEHRIDGPFISAKEARDKRVREYLHQQDQGLSPEKVNDEIVVETSEPTMRAFEEYEEQEFNPYYYTGGRIAKSCLDGRRSNDWNLRLKFHKYFQEFEDSIKGTSQEVHNLEKSLLLQKEEEEKNPKLKQEKQQMSKSQDVIKKSKQALSMKAKFQSKSEEDEAKLMQQIENEGKKKKKRGANKQAYDMLYKDGLKHAIVRQFVNEKEKIALSEGEKQAAENLAKALSNFDEKDPRVLRFTHYATRKDEAPQAAEAVKIKQPLPKIAPGKRAISSNIMKSSLPIIKRK